MIGWNLVAFDTRAVVHLGEGFGCCRAQALVIDAKAAAAISCSVMYITSHFATSSHSLTLLDILLSHAFSRRNEDHGRTCGQRGYREVIW